MHVLDENGHRGGNEDIGIKPSGQNVRMKQKIMIEGLCFDDGKWKEHDKVDCMQDSLELHRRTKLLFKLVT